MREVCALCCAVAWELGVRRPRHLFSSSFSGAIPELSMDFNHLQSQLSSGVNLKSVNTTTNRIICKIHFRFFLSWLRYWATLFILDFESKLVDLCLGERKVNEGESLGYEL